MRRCSSIDPNSPWGSLNFHLILSPTQALLTPLAPPHPSPTPSPLLNYVPWIKFIFHVSGRPTNRDYWAWLPKFRWPSRDTWQALGGGHRHVYTHRRCAGTDTHGNDPPTSQISWFCWRKVTSFGGSDKWRWGANAAESGVFLGSISILGREPQPHVQSTRRGAPRGNKHKHINCKVAAQRWQNVIKVNNLCAIIFCSQQFLLTFK